MEKPWFVYILECQDGSFYTGVTNNIEKRLKSHSEGKGSKYVKNRKFGKLLRLKKCLNRSDAQRAEYQIKKLPRIEKLGWFD